MLHTILIIDLTFHDSNSYCIEHRNFAAFVERQLKRPHCTLAHDFMHLACAR